MLDPLFASLSDEPRFKALLDRIADDKAQQRKIARQENALEGYDELILAGPAIPEVP